MNTQHPIAIITGAAKRIGKATAFSLAEQGYGIALHYNSSKDEAENVARQIREAHNVPCDIFQANLLDSKERDALIPNIVAKMGAPALLINNASIFHEKSFADSSEKNLDDNMRVHLYAPYFLSQAFAQHAKDGNIINIVDSYITTTQPMHFPYLLSKKALADLTPMLARVLAPHIRVNAIAISHTELGNVHEPGMNPDSAKRMPLKTVVMVDDITLAVHHILEQQRMTGQCLFVDSGHSIS